MRKPTEAFMMLFAAAALLLALLAMPHVTSAENKYRKAGKTFKNVFQAARQAPKYEREYLSGSVVQTGRKKGLPENLNAGFVREISYDSIFPERAGRGGESDYLSFGYWMKNGSVGAFVEGRGISGKGWTSGSSLYSGCSSCKSQTFDATYSGLTKGLYSKKWGKHSLHEGSRVVGEMTGTVKLEASFGAANGSGIIGSIRDATVAGTLYRKNGDTEMWNAPGPSINFVAGIKSNGTFSGSTSIIDLDPHKQTYEQWNAIPWKTRVKTGNTSWNHPGAYGLVDQGGNFGGRFAASRDPQDGRPRFVVGTYGGWLETGSGSKSAVVGSFFADKDRVFERP